MNEAEFPVSKKLKRGLEDLSPLFQLPSSQVATASPRVLFDVQFLTVCVPDHEGDAFLANAYLASQIVRQANLFASLVSIVPGYNSLPSKLVDPFPSLELLDSRISRLVLSHQELWTFTQNGNGRNGYQVSQERSSTLAPHLIFLEFEPTRFRSLARVALLLDRVVLFVQPQVESLREAYRLIKMFWNLNREIEFLLLFRGRLPLKGQEEFLFERFSLITSRFIGISTGWLGNLNFPEKTERPQVPMQENSGFKPASILAPEGLRRPLSPEKVRFWNEFQKILQTRFSREAHFNSQ